MIVVVPEAHALPPEATPMTNPDFWVNFNEYWAKNQSTADQELFKDIIPLSKSATTSAMNLRSEP